MTVAGRLLRGPRLLRLQGTASKAEDSSRYERPILILWDQSASPAVYKLFFALDLSDMNEFGNGAAQGSFISINLLRFGRTYLHV